MTLARLGDSVRAKALADELAKDNPLNTVLKVYWLPTIRAVVEPNAGNPAQTLVSLEAATLYDLGSRRRPPREPFTHLTYVVKRNWRRIAV